MEKIFIDENVFTFSLFCIFQNICIVLIVKRSVYYCCGFSWIFTVLFFSLFGVLVLLRCFSLSLMSDWTSCSHSSQVSFSFSVIPSMRRLFLRDRSSNSTIFLSVNSNLSGSTWKSYNSLICSCSFSTFFYALATFLPALSLYAGDLLFAHLYHSESSLFQSWWYGNSHW